MIEYKGKLALVTGASSGIGRAYAEQLAAQGCHVILAARSQDKLEEIAKELSAKYGVQTHSMVSDLSKPGSASQLAEQIAALGLEVHILINNAGFGTHGRFEALSNDREQEEIIVNISSLVELTHCFLPGMLSRKDGIVVNVASLGAFQPGPYSTVYCATKAFVLSFSESLWAETHDRGVRVLALCPGATQTGFFDAAGSHELADGNLSTPMDVARAGFRGIEQGRCYIVEGRKNYWLAQIHRFFTRKRAALVMERMRRHPSFDGKAAVE
jgi:short-subunit dehydrogenase